MSDVTDTSADEPRDIPLGRHTEYADGYDRGLLFTLSRADARQRIGLAEPLPFSGVDQWTAWELSWLEPDGRPVVAVLRFEVPADSERLIESKSLKLYLNGFAMTHFDDAAEVAARISADLGDAAGADIQARLATAADSASDDIDRLPGRCIDDEPLSLDACGPDPSLLRRARATTHEKLHSHLLRSLCPVTGQPDTGSIAIEYRGPRIDRAALLAYLVGFRQHRDFHELCVERIFGDLLQRCEPRELTVHAFYNRRGGIDINPFRSNVLERAPALRLWRQ